MKRPFLLCFTLLCNNTIITALPSEACAVTSPSVADSPGHIDSTPKSLKKSDWASIRAAHTAWQHGFTPVEGQPGVWQARNPGQQWTTKFDGRGFLTTPKDGGWTWGLELEGAAEAPKSTGTHAADNSGRATLSFPRGSAITEWFINDQRGLEQGWTLTAPAEIRLRVRGNLKASVSPQTVSFGLITYSGLKAWDATGKTVPAHFEATAQGFAVRYDDSGAQYPITIDPIAQQAYLKVGDAGPGNSDDQFGFSIAISGDTVVVGVPREDSGTSGINSPLNESANDSGAACVFVRNGTTWSQQAFLKASQVSAEDRFGWSVAVSGDTVVVGAVYESSSTTGINSTPNESASAAGAAYVFVRSGTTWSQQAYLKAGQVTAGDEFGSAVAVSGDTVVVGAGGEDSSTVGINSTPNENAPAAGAVYVFARSGTTWSQQAYLKASQVTAGDGFGRSASVSGDTVVVGASGEDSDATGINSTPNENAFSAGAAYVFTRSGTTWSQQAYLKASQINLEDFFGRSVGVSGNTVVIGASGEDSGTNGINSTPDESASSAGAAYVFVRSGTTWSQQAYLKASQVTAGDGFGQSVAVSGDTVVVGAFWEDSSTTGINSTANESAADAGAAFVFVRSGTMWGQQAYLKASQVTAGDYFGWSVAVSGDTVVVGAYLEDSGTTGVNSTPDESAIDAGAAQVFVRNATTWSHQSYVKTGNTGFGGAGDQFGWSVAVSGDTVIVGAPYEDSSTTGVNSAPDGLAVHAGAAYVFVRNGTTWSQQAYLKASQVTAGDCFGWSVAASGDTVVVGAYLEDSGTTGINSTPLEGANDSGAACVFVRNGTTWSQQAYLKASQVNPGDYFGWSVAASGDTVVVGAFQEDSSTTGVNSTPNENSANAGASYIFVRNGTTWSQQAYLKAGQVTAGDGFGYSVAVAGNTVAVGSIAEDSNSTGVNSTPNESASSAGAAYVFTRSGTTWSQQAYLKASQVTAGDRFGNSVAVSADTVVVGANREDSGTPGINSTPNESAGDAGAAYVFTRIGAAWSQQAYLKPGQVTAGDNFGHSVAVAGDTVVVGAIDEDSSTTGINSTPNENAFSAGAAYVFMRSGTMWSQQTYLKAGQVSPGDRFGYSVAVSGDTVIVGASGDDSSTTGVNSLPDELAGEAGAVYIFPTPLVPAEIALSGNGVNITTGDLTPQVSDHTDFGGVIVAGGTSARQFTITNEGGSALNLTGMPRVALSGSPAFSVNQQPASGSVESGGGMQVFQITFTPTTPGPQNATVSISSNDADENPFTFALSGTGLTGLDIFTQTMHLAGLSGPDAAQSAIPFNDGTANLLKYAFNLNLAAADTRTLTPGTGTAGLPHVSTAGGMLRVEYLRRIGSELHYTPQCSETMGPASWTALTAVPVVTPVDAAWERVVVEQALPPGRCFARVRVGFEPWDGFEWITVGEPGNAADPATGYGVVAAAYRLSAFEVTIAQYAEFLNAVAVQDNARLLWHPWMATDLNVAGIARTGAPGSYAYTPIGQSDRPIAYISWMDAARFVNWLHNERGSSGTESGVYDLSLAPENITRQPGALYFLPSENEWYKAAFHVPGGTWHLYPSGSSTLPANNVGALPNSANFNFPDYTLTPGDNTYSAVTPYLTAAGAFTGSASPWGTFDQGGNVWEWTEGQNGAQRVRRGGSWGNGEIHLRSTDRTLRTTDEENSTTGFRIARPAAP